jgi:DNA repair protein RecO (recombination protein O)
MEQTQGIVIRWFRYSDSSLIVHWVTQDHGRLNTMARGALRAKSSFKGKLDLFNQCQLSFKRSRQSTLHTLHEVQLQKHHSALSRQLSRFEQTCYASQLISQCIEEDTPVEGLFELFDA